jgi:cell division protein FtsA
VVVAEGVKETERVVPRVIGVGYAESKGLRHGCVLNQSDVVKSLEIAISQAEKSSGMKIKRAALSIGGIGLSGIISNGMTVISRADNKITDLDIEKAVETSLTEIPAAVSVNRKVIHTIPIVFKVDGKQIWGKPTGMTGMKLEVKTLFITCLDHHLNDLIEAAAEAGVEAEDVVAAPIAASLVTLTKTQKIAGCVLANIGSETVSIAVFENDIPISLEVFPFGSNDITNDIALGLRVPLEEAEEIKKGSIVGVNYPRRKLEEIISARLSDIFELIEAHLKKIGRSGLLPAGIVITGGGSAIETIGELAKSALRLPSKIGTITFGEGSKGQIKDASWSVAYGLCIIGLAGGGDEPNSIGLAKRAKNDFLGWFKQFLP